MQVKDVQKPPKNKGGRPPEGDYHGVRIPRDLWEWATEQTGNASETIRELLREAKKRDRG